MNIAGKGVLLIIAVITVGIIVLITNFSSKLALGFQFNILNLESSIAYLTS